MANRSTRAERQPAPELPVARVCVDVPLPHLDRLFDYLVPAELHEPAQPGTRVKVRFAGQLVDGWLIERAAESAVAKLAYLEKVVSPEPVLTAEVAGLARAVADRYAGSLADVLRLAVPPRHARAEQHPARDETQPAETARQPAVAAEPPSHDTPASDDQTPRPPLPGEPGAEDHTGWAEYHAGEGFLRALRDGKAPRAVWSVLPGEDWPARIAEAAAVTLAAGRGVVAVVPDARDLDRLDAALAVNLGKGRHVTLAAGLGPAKRYRSFLAASRGQVKVVAGTRAAAFAPVADVGLVVIWDDGDDLHAEPRAPYPHAREVLLTRAQRAGAAALVAGHARTAEAQLLLETGWAREVAADRATLRRRTPVITPTGDDPQLARDPGAATARLPSLAWDAARAALKADAPVLVQVPRRGYLPSVSCATCRAPARCSACQGPLALRSSHAVPACRWCGRVAGDHVCSQCGGRGLRAAVTGARRTAEELGRAFPEIPVRTSGRDEVLTEVPAAAAVVVATPGAEPVAEGGYGAVLLLDSWALLTRADLRAGEEALRRWMTAAALARPGVSGGRVIVVADGGVPVVQALLRWDPGWHAARELAERRELRFPPAARMASLTGTAEAVADLLTAVNLPPDAELLGPVPADQDQERYLVRAPRGRAAEVAAALHLASGVRSARKAPDPVRVQVDATDLF
ncbi:primosomal protein N' [Asanoa siamensis]|uniref:Probable replication restart protein PriA n=1 Tax=Asanoa siamensis TaxID=926357 RepID=A0ABQ4CJJ1_9ACTN|nr:primosomal protein N' [Asanoa siamensis]GIF71449.1 putative primosomal protein N' [Asanoa siamensis]